MSTPEKIHIAIAIVVTFLAGEFTGMAIPEKYRQAFRHPVRTLDGWLYKAETIPVQPPPPARASLPAPERKQVGR